MSESSSDKKIAGNQHENNEQKGKEKFSLHTKNVVLFSLSMEKQL
jgi:hypothetical protein